MKKTFIVLFDVGHTFDARPLAESIEGENFELTETTGNHCETIYALRVRDEIMDRLGLDDEDQQNIAVYPITDFMDEFNNQEIVADSYFMGYVTATIIDIQGYDVFSDGKCKGTFLGGEGGFIYVSKDGTIDTSFQCDIEEYSDDEDGMYGLESVAIAKGLTFEYPILDVSEGHSIMMAKDLVEPMRSKFIFEWMERQHGEEVSGIIVDDQWGTYDADKITLAYNHFNPKPVFKVREDSVSVEKLIEILNISFNGVWYEVHVDATEERSIFETFAESGDITPEIYKHLEEVVNKINN